MGAGGSVPGRCLVAQGGVPAVVVVFGFPVGDDDPGLGEGPEGVDVEAFVSDPAVERFDVAVLPGFAGWDKESPTRCSAQSAIAVQASSGRLSQRSTAG